MPKIARKHFCEKDSAHLGISENSIRPRFPGAEFQKPKKCGKLAFWTVHLRKRFTAVALFQGIEKLTRHLQFEIKTRKLLTRVTIS